MKKRIASLFVFGFLHLFLFVKEGTTDCVGRFVNPVTDICWKCIFPITIGGVRVASGEDTGNPSRPICYCPYPVPRIGLPVSFWEPVRLVDVTREPYCMVSLGGIYMGPRNQIRGHGSVSHIEKSHMKQSFYQVHWYVSPILYWLELLTDFACLESSTFDVAYMTELDPLWGDDELSFILNPESVLFGNPIAQSACILDCGMATAGFGSDAFFWCDGCQGSLYPFTGSISAHSSGIQASLLATGRFMAKLHREGLLMGYMGEAGLCGKYPMPIIKKSQYKTQMTYPSPTNIGRGCHPLGRSDQLWSTGKNIPHKGEDFGYLIWRKRNCCLL